MAYKIGDLKPGMRLQDGSLVYTIVSFNAYHGRERIGLQGPGHAGNMTYSDLEATTVENINKGRFKVISPKPVRINHDLLQD